EDYEVTEKIGGGGSYAFETKDAGTHTLHVAAFYADNTFLSNSIITSRDHNSVSDGGTSNNGKPTSYTISLDGEDAGGIEGLTYMIGFRHLAEQAHGDDTTDDDNGINLNLGYVTDLNDEVSVDLMGEYAGFSDFDGVKHDDRNYYSASAITH